MKRVRVSFSSRGFLIKIKLEQQKKHMSRKGISSNSIVLAVCGLCECKIYLRPFAWPPNRFASFVETSLSGERFLTFIARIAVGAIRERAHDIAVLHGFIPGETTWLQAQCPFSSHPMWTLLSAALLHRVRYRESGIFTQKVIHILCGIV